MTDKIPFDAELWKSGKYDLFLIPKKRKVWIAIAKDPDRNGIVIGCAVAKNTKRDLLDYSTSDQYYHLEVELPE